MKKNFRILIVIAVLLFAVSANIAFAQPHPDQQSNGSSNGGTPINGSGGAPIGSGITILLSLAAAYGAKKVYTIRKSKADQ